MEIQELSTQVSDRFFRAFCSDPTAMYDLESLYNDYNAKFFYGELPELVKVVKKIKGQRITSLSRLKWDGRLRSRTYGTYTTGARPGKGIIRLSRNIASDPLLLKSTLLHEMLHQWLDLKDQDDGVRGHGENFINHARRINFLCQDEGLPIRVHFYNKEILFETPHFECDLIRETLYSVKDLDITRTMESVIKAAFNNDYETVY